MNFYKSKYTGTQIDSLLDKVKEDVVSKEDINTGTFDSTSDNPAGQKSIAGAMEKLDQSLQNQISTNKADIATNKADIATNKTDIAKNTADITKNTSDITKNTSAISSLESRTKNLEDTKEDINTGTFNPTSDNPASQKSIAGAIEKKQDKLTAGAGISIDNGVISVSYANADEEAF